MNIGMVVAVVVVANNNAGGVCQKRGGRGRGRGSGRRGGNSTRRRDVQTGQVDGHSPAPSRGIVVPHVRAHVYLQVALGGEGPAADGALEGLVAGVRSIVNLKRRPAGEGLVADEAHVLVITARTSGTRGSRTRGNGGTGSGGTGAFNRRSRGRLRRGGGVAAAVLSAVSGGGRRVGGKAKASTTTIITRIGHRSRQAEGHHLIGGVVGVARIVARVPVGRLRTGHSAAAVGVVRGGGGGVGGRVSGITRRPTAQYLADAAAGQKVAQRGVGGRGDRRVQVGREVANLVRQHVLLHVAPGGEAPVADLALEGPFLGVRADVNLQGGVAGEGLAADATGGVRAAGRVETGRKGSGSSSSAHHHSKGRGGR